MRYRNYLKRILNKKIVNAMNESFSQEGEDVIVKLYIEENKINSDGKGIYIDLGAHHPFNYSNTAIFYSLGWHGINIDADSESIKIFNRLRKRDININIGVAEKAGVMDYYCFNDSAINTFDPSLISIYEEMGFKYINKKQVNVVNINDLLEENLGPNDRIDLLDIDIEGYDKVIIDSLDWKKYSPTIVLTEHDILCENNNIDSDATMRRNGYRLYASTNRTSIYVKR